MIKKLILALLFLLLSYSVSLAENQQLAWMGPVIAGGITPSSAPASTMKQKLITSYGSALSVAATRYIPLVGTAISGPTEAAVTQLSPVSGTIRNLRVISSGAPQNGAGTQTYTITVRKASGSGAMANTTLTCTISEDETSCTDSSHSFTIAADDKLSMSVAFGSTPASASFSTMVEFQGDAANKVVLLGAYQYELKTDASTRYGVAFGCGANATETIANVVMPVAGTITGFYGRISAAPGASATRVWTIRKNGSDEASSELSFGEADVAKNATGLSIAVSQGDVLAIKIVGTGTQAAANGYWGILFEPTTNGEFPIVNSFDAKLTSGATKYGGISGALSILNDAHSATFSIANNDYTIKGMCVKLAVAPGSGKSSTYTPQAGSGDASNPAAVTIQNTDTLGCSTGDITPDSAVIYGTKLVNTDGDVSSVSIGYRGYITP